MEKTIKIKFLEGGASLQIVTGTDTVGKWFVYPFSKYSQSEIKDEKFYVPASREIFSNMSNEFKVLKRSYTTSQYEVIVREFQNGHYITITHDNDMVREFITEDSKDVTYSQLLISLLEVLFFSRGRVSYTENIGETLEFEIFS